VNKTNTRVFVITLAAMLATCGIVVLCTLTPLSSLGEHSNQFGDSGMFRALLGAAAPYIIPCIFLGLGIRPAKIFLAVVDGVFLFVSAAAGITGLILWQAAFGARPDGFMTAFLLCCALSVALHIIWFFVAFSRPRA